MLPFPHQLHALRELDHRQRAGAAAAAQLVTALAQRAAGGGALAVQQLAHLRVVGVRHRAVHGHDAAVALQVALHAADLDELAQLADQLLELGRELRMARHMLLQSAPAPVRRRRQLVHGRRIVDVARVQQAGRHLLGRRRTHRQERRDPGRQYRRRRHYREHPSHVSPNNTPSRRPAWPLQLPMHSQRRT